MKKLMHVGQAPNLSPLELMDALGYTQDSRYIKLRARCGGGDGKKHLKQETRGAEPGCSEQDVVGKFLVCNLATPCSTHSC